MKPFPDREPSAGARKAMETAAELTAEEGEEQIARCKKAFSSATGHSHVELTESGSDAIFHVLSAIDGSVLLPDQGIWKGTMKHCSELGIATHILSTDLGLIDPEELKKAIEKQDPRALFITSFAGYIAEQDIKEISRICRGNDVLLIEDASSSIGDRSLGKGRNADVIVGSARRPKLLNLDSGGFITTDNNEIAERLEKHNRFAPDPVICAGMEAELQAAQETLDRLGGFSASLKDRLEKVVHRERRGPCVGVLMGSPKKAARKAAQTGLVTESGRTVFTTCPRADRFLDRGLVIEVKKLDVESMGDEALDRITGFINEAQNKT